VLVGYKGQIERKLTNLYKLVENGDGELHEARRDDSLSKRFALGKTSLRPSPSS
jgi:hypothetical protein